MDKFISDLSGNLFFGGLIAVLFALLTGLLSIDHNENVKRPRLMAVATFLFCAGMFSMGFGIFFFIGWLAMKLSA